MDRALKSRLGRLVSSAVHEWVNTHDGAIAEY